MAEIGIEKKKPIWPWIILVLVILVILYFLFFSDGDTNNDRDNIDNTEQQMDRQNYQETDQDTVRFERRMSDTIGYLEDSQEPHTPPLL